MFPTVSLISVSVALASVVWAQTFPATPLASKSFPWPTGVPYQADTENLVRGRQTGYNICNSTTQGQESLCQTSFINSIDDFCIWGPKDPNSVVGDTEGEAVAWCSKPGHGGRLIPEGTLKGLQWTRTPDYVQIVGFIDQTRINMAAGDYGGEMDPHGADLRGNPIGGLVYSNGWSGNNDSYTQVIEWHNFVGNDFFCFKACDPSKTNAAHFCEHTLDRIGCAYNAPNNARDGVFEACQGENQDFPGVYTVNGVATTYRQPPESLGAITTMPYTARVPASSNCVTYTSAEIFAALASVSPDASVTPSSSSVTGTSSSQPTSSAPSSRAGTSSGTAAGAVETGNGADIVVMSGIVTTIGVVFSALFLS
ncbi:hypothetical protein EYR40_010808 [Pleurotus pulmonarius]|nr:hypothetical protein EYR36_002579 [Pleurotus pulmonarius]KAF4583353.1 hypothetical protein EYR38_002103 [Pleurotus pulmonarius]KAF4586792.1 hypothetical protein EYR40_010808 [Pleurotus pulmonarius]